MRRQVCVLSRRYEGMPLALIEGMAAGCAVVGSAAAGVREGICEGTDGRLAPEGNAEAMAQIWQALLGALDAAARRGAAARATALHDYGHARMNQDCEALISAIGA